MRHAFKNFLFIVLTYTSCLAVVCADECKGTVYLTFDTGNMAQAEEIGRTLNTEWVKATFFIANEKTVRGDYALDAGWADFWRARVAEGHAFGNHTWDHLYLRRDLNEHEVLVAASNGPAVRSARFLFAAQPC